MWSREETTNSAPPPNAKRVANAIPNASFGVTIRMMAVATSKTQKQTSHQIPNTSQDPRIVKVKIKIKIKKR